MIIGYLSIHNKFEEQMIQNESFVIDSLHWPRLGKINTIHSIFNREENFIFYLVDI